MTDSAMPAFRGGVPKQFDLMQKHYFDQDAAFVAADLLAGDEAGQRTIICTDDPLACKIDLLMRLNNAQRVIDVTMSLLDDAGQIKRAPEKVAELRLILEAARACRAELHVDRAMFVHYKPFINWLWIIEFVEGWRVREIKQAEKDAALLAATSVGDGQNDKADELIELSEVEKRVKAKYGKVTPKRIEVMTETINAERLEAHGLSEAIIAERLGLDIDTIRRRLGKKK
jgi:hypothetical protein